MKTVTDDKIGTVSISSYHEGFRADAGEHPGRTETRWILRLSFPIDVDELLVTRAL